MYGLPPGATKQGCTLRELLELRRKTGTFSADPEAFIEGLAAASAQGSTLERTVELPDGRTIAIVHRPMAGGGWLVTHDDITSRVRAEAKMSHMALHDALTNLPNRLFFRKELESRLAHLARGQKCAVLCLDLDNFKSVNDTLGHPFGDNLLCQVADRLRACLREGDSVARIGGDEFAVLHSSIVEPSETTSLMTRIIEVVGSLLISTDIRSSSASASALRWRPPMPPIPT